MSLIKFKNFSDIINVNLFFDSSGRVKISFNKNSIPSESVLLSGFFEINEHNFIEQSDFSDMNYLYQKIDDLTYVLTKEKDDVYIESNIPELPELPEYSPTIDDARNMKISSLSYICNKQIVNGVDIDIDGLVEHFSYTEEDQTNIKELFDLAVQTNVPLYYHSDGHSCKLYTVEQIISIYTTAAMNKMHHITYFNQLKIYLQSLDDIENIKDIEYGYELTGEYLDTYNAAMEQARFGMEALLKVEQLNE